MEFIRDIVNFALHIDKHLNTVIQNFGNWSYLLLFGVIFLETGFVIAPFLPGDSLLFAVGAFSALGSMNLLWFFIILSVAAIIGDSVNYTLGKLFGEKIVKKENLFFKKEYLDRTHKFYEKYGCKTIILARFLPIIRTFAPFAAGIGEMKYCKFFFYNVIGGILWVAIFLFGGYYFGNMPLIKENFFIAVLAIMALSVAPVVVEFLKHRKALRS